MARWIWAYTIHMKTTVELPDKLLEDTRRYASERGKTFKDVLIEALGLLVSDEEHHVSRPGWEQLFGTFAKDVENAKIQEVIELEFSIVNPKDWK